KLEADLKAARERLEAAAREVANLSSQLTGPVAHDFLMGHRLSGQGAMLGIGIERPGGQDGVKVECVTPDGAADIPGVKVGRVIVSLDGNALKDGRPGPATAPERQMASVRPGQKAALEILRDGRKRTVEVTAEARAFGAGALA